MHSGSRGLGPTTGAVGVIMAAFAGSTLITPLYALYQDAFGFSEVTLTLVYAVYVVGNVIALLIFGRLSDQIGRRRAAIPAVGLAAACSWSPRSRPRIAAPRWCRATTSSASRGTPSP